MMNTSWMLPLLALGIFDLNAKAQVGVYGHFDYTHYTDHTSNSSNSYAGPGFGVYYDFLHAGPLEAGLDLRTDYVFGSTAKYRDLLAGVRLQAKPPVLKIKPYAQLSLGIGGPQPNGPFPAGITGATFRNKFTYEVVGGADLAVLPHIDFRVVELGYGRQTGVAGSMQSNPDSTLFTVRSGVVFRL
jgi:hypothetical protein